MGEMPNDNDPVWERIEILMKSRGMNQKEFAAKMGVTPTTVTDWKNGKSKSYQRIVVMFNIANALGMTLESMFPEWCGASTPDRTEIMQLSEDETALIGRYRQFNQAGKTQIQNLSESMKRSGMYKPSANRFVRSVSAEY